MERLSNVASAEWRTKEPSNVCRSIKVLVFNDKGCAPASAERCFGGGVLNGEYNIPISEVPNTFALCEVLSRARSGEGKVSIMIPGIYPKCKGMLTFGVAGLEDL